MKHNLSAPWRISHDHNHPLTPDPRRLVMSESSSPMTVQQVYQHCLSYHALLKHPHRPRLAVITNLLNCIRTYKSQHSLPSLEAAFDAHRQYVLHPPPSHERKKAGAVTSTATVVEPSAATVPPTSQPPLTTSTSATTTTAAITRDQQPVEQLQCQYSRLEQRVIDLESKYQQRIDELERKVNQIEWQPDNRLPRRINRSFTILDELGAGPRAIVYKCINRNNNMRVALKVAQDPVEFNVVRNDALIIHRIEWRYLIRIHGSPESLSDPTMMKHIDAIEMTLFQGTLSSDLQAFDRGQRPQHTPAFCLQHLDGLLRELAGWHTKGVVHCDIKPENIVWSDDEQRYALIDFGHAIRADDYVVAKRATTIYSAPEALGCCDVRSIPQNQRWATKADVWSLGLTLMYVCSTRPRRPVFSMDGPNVDNQQRRAKVSNAVAMYLKLSPDERRRWLSQRLHIEEPAVKSSMLDLLLGMICEPEQRWDLNVVRNHKLWSQLM